MTASTTTSKTSRRSDEALDVAEGVGRAAPSWETAMDLGEELRADPFKLLAARIPQFDFSTIQTAGELDRKPNLRLDVGSDRTQLRCRIDSLLAPRSIGPDPVLGLTDRKMPRDHHLQPVLLRGLAFERDQGPSVSRGDDAGANSGLDSGTTREQSQRMCHRHSMLADALRDLFVSESELFS